MNEENKEKQNQTKNNNVLNFFLWFAITFAALVAVYNFLSPFQILKVSGISMMPTLQDGQWYILDTRTSTIDNIQNGDIVVAKKNGKYVIKRVLGTQGDELRLNFTEDESAVCLEQKVGEEWKKLDEPYINEPMEATPNRYQKATGEQNIALTSESFYENTGKFYTYWKCGKDEYAIFGDNRNHSSDSRAYGVVKKEEVCGKAIYFFPKKK